MILPLIFIVAGLLFIWAIWHWVLRLQTEEEPIMLRRTDVKGESDAQAGSASSNPGAGDRLASSSAASQDGEGNVDLLPVSVAARRLTELATISTGDPALDDMAHGVAVEHLRRLDA